MGQFPVEINSDAACAAPGRAASHTPTATDSCSSADTWGVQNSSPARATRCRRNAGCHWARKARAVGGQASLRGARRFCDRGLEMKSAQQSSERRVRPTVGQASILGSAGRRIDKHVAF